ncbi:MAG: flagellar protein FlaG [Succinivibrio sp.]
MSYINAVNSAVQQYGDSAYVRNGRPAQPGADASSAAAQDEASAAVQSGTSAAAQVKDGSEASSALSGSWADALSKAQSDQAAKSQEESDKSDQISEEELEKQREQARELTQKLNAQNIGLNFDLDDTYDRMVIKVTNKNTQDLVRQIPSEDLMRFQKVISDFESGDKAESASTSYGTSGDSSQSLASAIKGLIFDTRA